MVGCALKSTAHVQENRQDEVLPEGVIARVGPSSVRAEQVATAASAQRIDSRAALAGEIDDALWASGAIARGLENDPGVRSAIRGRLARAALGDLWAEQRSNPLTDAEVVELTALHFMELDRPEATRVIHALISTAREADAATRTEARALAQRLAKAVQSATTAADFESMAQQVERGRSELRVEVLSPVAKDGRVVDLERPSSGERYVEEFAQAAAALRRPGDKSPVIETPFGFHVLMMLGRQEAFALPLEERRARLAEEGFTRRGRARADELVRRLRAIEMPTTERGADALLRTVEISER